MEFLSQIEKVRYFRLQGPLIHICYEGKFQAHLAVVHNVEEVKAVVAG